MQTICTSLQTHNHTNTSSLNFYRPDALPDAQPTVSKRWRTKALKDNRHAAPAAVDWSAAHGHAATSGRCWSTGQTDGRTSDRYIDTAAHTMRAASKSRADKEVLWYHTWCKGGTGTGDLPGRHSECIWGVCLCSTCRRTLCHIARTETPRCLHHTIKHQSE